MILACLILFCVHKMTAVGSLRGIQNIKSTRTSDKDNISEDELVNGARVHPKVQQQHSPQHSPENSTGLMSSLEKDMFMTSLQGAYVGSSSFFEPIKPRYFKRVV